MKIDINGKKREVGQVFGKKFITFRNGEHYVKKYQGFGINEHVLNKLINSNVEDIVIIYKKADNTQTKYKTTPRKWSNRGYRDKLGNFERQVFLPLKLFDNSNTKTKKRHKNSKLSSYLGCKNK